MGSLYKRGNTWWVKYYQHGGPIREGSGTAKETETRRFLKLREGQVAQVKQVILTAWQNACQQGGQPGRLVHDLRRTAVRNTVRMGVSERVAMQMSGHKAKAIFDRYNIVSEGDLWKAARKLSAQLR
jgi:hypothetical protein